MSAQRSVRLRRWSLALGTSIVAMGIGSSAQAQCAPDPTVANGTTNCSGTDNDGLAVTTSNTRVIVATDATVLRGSVAAAIVNTGSGTRISIDGRVDGGAAPGIFVTTDPAYYGRCPEDPYAGASVPFPFCPPGSFQWVYPSSSTSIEVSAGAIVSGSQALSLQRNPNNSLGGVSATLTNAGTLTGTAGPALVTALAANGINLSVTNLAGGTIAGMRGQIDTLTNAGLVTAAGGRAFSGNGGVGIVNTGRIVADGGTAIAANSAMVTNSGTISASGGTAITVAGTLRLTNSGTITGAVEARGGSSFQGSTIDTRTGTIDGSLTLGTGDDTLLARYDAGSLVTGITGAIDGGAGVDTLRIGIDADTTLGAVTLPTRFERLGLALVDDVTVTLDSAFGGVGGLLQLEGSGTVVNQGTLTGAAPVVSDGTIIGSPAFINAGAIRSTGGDANSYAVDLWSARRFQNDGEVTASGNGVAFGGQAFTNAGSITAAGIAVRAYGNSFANSGTIRSTAGTGASLGGSSGSGYVNDGTIEGATIGVQLYGSLVNNGTIASPGIGVELGSGTLDNRAGGRITGDITPQVQRFFTVTNATVINAGTIDGNVRFDGSGTFSFSNNRYFALAGGVLNGNLTLGSGNTLITELTNTGSGAFAGITGTVTATDTALVYRVRGAGNTIGGAAPAGFSSVGYDLYDAAALTLTGVNAPLSLAGSGSVDVSGDITASSRPAIQATGLTLAPDELAPTAGTLTVVSRGTVTLERAENDFGGYAAVAAGDAGFTNAGTIVVRSRLPSFTGQTYAISGSTVVNDGTISLDGAIGIGAARVTNSGTIAQIADGRASRGISQSFSALTLTNSGTIDVAGDAVTGGFSSTIDNSGRIASSGGFAIGVESYGAATITNRVGGTIAGNGTAIRIGGGSLVNSGTITGSVDLGYNSFGRAFNAATYDAQGGTIAGDLLFGNGDDTLIVYDDVTGVSGTIDGGAGANTYIHARTTTGTVTLGAALPTGFQNEGARAIGAETVVTLRAAAPLTGGLRVSGDGAIVNTVDLGGQVTTTDRFVSFGSPEPILTSFTNQAKLDGGFDGSVRRFVNAASGIIAATGPITVVRIVQSDALDFVNEGRIDATMADTAVSLSSTTGVTAANSGTITGPVWMSIGTRENTGVPQQIAASLTNTGTITATGDQPAVQLGFSPSWNTSNSPPESDVALTLVNRGTIESAAAGGQAAFLYAIAPTLDDVPIGTRQLAITNSGTIRANGGAVDRQRFDPFTGEVTSYTVIAGALGTSLDTGRVTIVNTATGTIEATGERSVALYTGYRDTLDLTNAGTIRGGGSFTVNGDETAGAIQTGSADDRIVNTGTIIGAIALGDGNDRVENDGRIEGDVFLGNGDDTFLHRVSATLIGTVDAGAGDDSLVVDATGGGTVRGSQFVNFERFSQIGAGAVDYVGAFRTTSIGVTGGTVTVAAGETLSSDGPVTITGSDAAETVVNAGTIAGAVALGAGNDRVDNAGTIGGAVLLGDGDDAFVERAGSSVAGGVDGGAGTDRYTAILTGDRSGLGARSGFETLAVTGTGTLTLTLDQRFDAVTLAGTGLALTLDGFTVGAVTGSDARETLAVDGDVARVMLGAGDDMLALGTVRAAGVYAGGAGNDTLRFTSTAPVTLAGTASGFETVALAGNALAVAGTLGAVGETVTFGNGAQTLVVGDGGRLAGTVDLGAGNDTFRLAATGIIDGSVNGGVGDDTATVVLAAARTLAAGTLTGFETLASEGTGTLTLTGAQAYDRVNAGTGLTIDGGATLTTAALRFGAADDRLTIAGGFAGAVDGGAGNDTIAVTGGNQTTPVAFSSVTNIEALAMSAGFATVSGNAAFGTVDLTGGRLVGLAGSTIAASRIAVAQGATFGSAGTVNASLAVAGILSPGASPGTMTVNGNVALAGGSRALFELTPTVSDKLVINGALSIASGSTLELTTTGTLRPGTSYDLITASGGISGGFTTIVKPVDLFGFVVQRADRIQLLGQFLTATGTAPQVARSIAYANATLAVQPATSTLFASLPALLDASGASNRRGFAQLTPEAYASATQLGVDHALTLSQVARGTAFATDREDAGPFTFAQTVGQWHSLAGDARQGSARAQMQSYGFLGGLGYGDRHWMVGAFAGYLNGRQQIAALGARTRADGVVAGVHARYGADAGWGFGASVLYDGGDARTDRALPGGRGATGRYGLHSWVSDLSAHYGLAVGDGWSLSPRVGVTYVRTTRDGVAEDGGSAFALRVARDRHVAGFADAGLAFARSDASDAPFRPFVSLGARYQIEGQRAAALAGYAGGGLGLNAVGASRAELVGTAAGGVGYRLPSGLDIFASASAQTGRDDHQETITAGVRLRF